jgi:hypothetical protein
MLQKVPGLASKVVDDLLTKHWSWKKINPSCSITQALMSDRLGECLWDWNLSNINSGFMLTSRLGLIVSVERCQFAPITPSLDALDWYNSFSAYRLPQLHKAALDRKPIVCMYRFNSYEAGRKRWDERPTGLSAQLYFKCPFDYAWPHLRAGLRPLSIVWKWGTATVEPSLFKSRERHVLNSCPSTPSANT